MRNVVERFTHRADERLVFVEKRVEEDDQFVQFVFGLPCGNAGVELAGANDRAGSGDNLADGLHRTVAEECAGEKSGPRPAAGG